MTSNKVIVNNFSLCECGSVRVWVCVLSFGILSRYFFIAITWFLFSADVRLLLFHFSRIVWYFFFVSVISWVETFVNGSFIIVMVTMMLTTRSLYFYIDDVDGDQIHLKINSKWYGHSRSFFVRERIKSFSGRQKKKEKKKMKNLLHNKCRGQFSRSFFCRLLDVPLVQNGYS